MYVQRPWDRRPRTSEFRTSFATSADISGCQGTSLPFKRSEVAGGFPGRSCGVCWAKLVANTTQKENKVMVEGICQSVACLSMHPTNTCTLQEGWAENWGHPTKHAHIWQGVQK